MAFAEYADSHNGIFPYDPDGYGDALLQIDEIYDYCLTGPGYSPEPFKRARQSGSHLSEAECGRVYIQGLSRSHRLLRGDLVILYDKLPTPGGDHAHIFERFWAPYGREILFMTGGHRFVPQAEWPALAEEQIELLVEYGLTREEAEGYYRN